MGMILIFKVRYLLLILTLCLDAFILNLAYVF